MQLRKLLLKNFRNYEYQQIAFNEGTTLFFGGNAQGKTNALEAIFLLSTGRSHRTGREKDMIKSEENFARIYAEIEHFDGKHTVEIILSRNERKRILLNGIPVTRVGEMMGHLCTVIFSPEDLKLVKEGPGERRRFMDFGITQADKRYFYNLQRYNKILDERNSLLKGIQKNPELEKTLEAWNIQLCETAQEIILSRQQFVEKLKVYATDIHKEISGNKEKLEINYQSATKNAERGEIFNDLLDKLNKNQKEDIVKGNTAIGPHREDIGLKINGVDVRTFGSQGQQRTAALALKLAEIDILREKTGETPVLLLDDVMSELDTDRQKFLISRLHGIQTVITCTGIDHSFEGAKVYFIKSGKITQQE